MESVTQDIESATPEMGNGAWRHFDRQDESNAKCKTCEKVIKTTKGNTSGMRKHLDTIHNVRLASKRKIVHVDCVEQDTPDTVGKVISRMAAVDGIAFVRFTASKDIRLGLHARGFKQIPRSANSIRQLVLDHTEFVKEEIRKDIVELKGGFKLSLSLDEWSSVGNRRYLNANVHANGRVLNLGLHRINGSANAKKLFKLLAEVVADFGIDMKRDIISITTDAATVMKCLGKSLGTHQQLCYAHGLHLAVTDNLFKKIPTRTINNNNSDLELIGVDDYNDMADDINHDLMDGFAMENEVVDLRTFTDESNLSSLLEKVRKVSRIFRRSPTKNDDALQPLVKVAHQRELKCLLDCKTRWNSTVDMISRFLLLYKSKSLQHALIAVDSKIEFEETEIQLLSDIERALEPLKAAIKMLCRRNSNLLEADSAISLLIDDMAQQTSPFSQKLRESIIKRFMERRTVASRILQFLHSQNTVPLHQSFVRAKSTDTLTFVADLWSKYHTRDGPLIIEPEREATFNIEGGTFEERLEAVLKRDCRETKSKFDVVLGNTVEEDVLDELDIFKKTSVRGPKLSFAYNNLLQIIPTSVEAERNFSASGRICNKITSRLSDVSINALSILRFFFMNE